MADIHNIFPSLEAKQAKMEDLKILQTILEETRNDIAYIANKLIQAQHLNPSIAEDIGRTALLIGGIAESQITMAVYQNWCQMHGVKPTLN